MNVVRNETLALMGHNSKKARFTSEVHSSLIPLQLEPLLSPLDAGGQTVGRARPIFRTCALKSVDNEIDHFDTGRVAEASPAAAGPRRRCRAGTVVPRHHVRIHPSESHGISASTEASTTHPSASLGVMGVTTRISAIPASVSAIPRRPRPITPALRYHGVTEFLAKPTVETGVPKPNRGKVKRERAPATVWSFLGMCKGRGQQAEAITFKPSPSSHHLQSRAPERAPSPSSRGQQGALGGETPLFSATRPLDMRPHQSVFAFNRSRNQS